MLGVLSSSVLRGWPVSGQQRGLGWARGGVEDVRRSASGWRPDATTDMETCRKHEMEPASAGERSRSAGPQSGALPANHCMQVAQRSGAGSVGRAAQWLASIGR